MLFWELLAVNAVIIFATVALGQVISTLVERRRQRGR